MNWVTSWISLNWIWQQCAATSTLIWIIRFRQFIFRFGFNHLLRSFTFVLEWEKNGYFLLRSPPHIWLYFYSSLHSSAHWNTEENERIGDKNEWNDGEPEKRWDLNRNIRFFIDSNSSGGRRRRRRSMFAAYIVSCWEISYGNRDDLCTHTAIVQFILSAIIS